MRGIGPTSRSQRRAACACLLMLITAGCDAPSSPVAPTPPSTSTPPTSTAPPAGPWKELGEYTMTMTAAPACSLPDYARVRAYGAHVRENGPNLIVEFDDPDFVCEWWGCGFTGTQDGGTTRFSLTSWEPGATEYAFIYQVNAATELGYIGSATGAMRDGVFAAAFNGAVVLYQGDTFPHRQITRCDAPDHRLELVRR